VAQPTPKIDERTPQDIARQVQSLSYIFAGEWLREHVPADERPKFDPAKGMSAALIGVFSRFAEIIIQRLNSVPDKNFLAFLDLLGASQLPPQPARAPLTFALANGTVLDALVPAGTQVAAPPAEGENEPIIFETERELVVTAAQLDAVFVLDPEQDTYADNSLIVAPTPPIAAPVFQGNRRLEHLFYIAQEKLLGYDGAQLAITLDIEPVAGAKPLSLRWEIWDGLKGVQVQMLADGTKGLTTDGQVLVYLPKAVPLQSVEKRASRWLRCRLLQPLSNAQESYAGMLSEADVPLVKSISLSATLKRTGMPADAAFLNTQPLDITKDFFPFGEKPRYGDTFYLSNKEAFSKGGASFKLYVTLVNPTGAAGTPVPPVKANNVVLVWEYWNGTVWAKLGQSESAKTSTFDATKAFTASSVISFALPADAAPATVNGVENIWIRARLVSGNYGEESRFELVNPNDPSSGYKRDDKGNYNLLPATYAPPVVKSLAIEYELVKTAPPDAVLTYNDFAYADGTGHAFKPFEPMDDRNPSLYLGFSLPAGRTSFPNRKISFYCGMVEAKFGDRSVPISPRRSVKGGEAGAPVTHKFIITNPFPQPATFDVKVTGTRWPVVITPAQLTINAREAKEVEVALTIPANESAESVERGFITITAASGPPYLEATAAHVTYAGGEDPAQVRPHLAWEYWNGSAWATINVRDETANLTLPGLVEFLAPPDFASHDEFGLKRFWLRVRWHSGQYESDPRLRRLLLNTTMAAQTVTVTDEILGSSDASKYQKFRTTQAPVLAGQQLDVREPEIPSATEQERMILKDGGETLTIVSEGANVKEIWVRWQEVPDFYGSGPRDRHYVLNRLLGEISFGDGLHGMIPPLDTGNLRLTSYRTGGGVSGNRPAGTITQLKTTVPYVDKVTNVEPSTGGGDVETLDSLIARAPRMIRHRGRAVTLEDYEDLARLASTDIARAKCVPLANLAADPDAPVQRLGSVSLIIVPRSSGARPQPSLELTRRVREYVNARRLPVGELVVVGPEYVRVDVEVAVSLSSLEGAGEVEANILATLARYLHPLTGGLDGLGWDFGRKPYRSDLFAVLEPIAGVDHINSLTVMETEERDGVRETNRFLVYSGKHKITLTFDE
jgi:hypothetical protein